MIFLNSQANKLLLLLILPGIFYYLLIFGYFFIVRSRKPKLSLRSAWKLCRTVNINSTVVLKDIIKSLDMMCINISSRTIQHCLNRNGLYGNQLWRPFFPNHMTLLLSLILPKLSWTNCFREQILWGDEIKIEFFGHNNVQKIWCKKGKAFLLKNIMPH